MGARPAKQKPPADEPVEGNGRPHTDNPDEPIAVRVLDYIAANGVKPIAELGKTLGVGYQSVYSAVSGHDWFEKASDGVHLSSNGWSMAKIRQGKMEE